ncbi:palmitoyl-protein thioesterase ABHD10, mitochondrial-like isoform X2 [Stegostoma tigrinum]|uniref:palmitoyl-protein thioesterase ABHD10, mitochondrial-like isoform X2 n=1 Tax=Stegostoma tigrinum TaxID=3053191 RepID=UPI0028704395|nr:palmitoyl-protein thioesterase ABHD10, mitochondrial-like isoform X2 [Stegostoma tigrinum]
MNIQCPFPFAPLGVMAAAVLRRLPGLIAVGSSALWRPVPWPHAVGCCKKSTKYLARPDQPKLAYKKIKGRSPGVIFLPGFASTMKAQKGLELEDFCKSLGHSFIRFDYSGCGASEGKFSESTIGQWKKDVLAVLDELSEGPQTQKEIEAKGEWYLPNLQKGSEFHKIPYTFLKDAENHRVLHSTIPITCPVRLIHGMKDDHIPWQISLNVAQNVLSSDVDLILRKHGQHRMAEKDDVKLIVNIIDDVIDKLRTMA